MMKTTFKNNLRICKAIVLAMLFSMTVKAQEDKKFFIDAKNEIESMLSGKSSLDYERAVFIAENAYYNNGVSYSLFKSDIDFKQKFVEDIAKRSFEENRFEQRKNILVSPDSAKANQVRLAKNYAIYKFITEISFAEINNSLYMHNPYHYANNDPFASENWENSQVLNLITDENKAGNCNALTSLFKILSLRLNTNANLCVTQGHVFITHLNENGISYNVELGSKAFPGTGSIEVLTHTTDESVRNGIAMRELNLKQSVGLCLIDLAKGYQHKFKIKADDFMLQCAEMALKYDSLNLNAMLLKAEVLEEMLISQNKPIEKIRSLNDFKVYESLIKELYVSGYREMPVEMKNRIIAAIAKDTNFISPYKDNAYYPFAKIDKNYKRTWSMSGGMFEEEDIYKPKEKYFRTVFNAKTKRIESFTTADTLYNRYNYDPVVFAWNVDPLASKYPHETPYGFCSNNPIIYMDPDGREKIIVIGGGDITGKDPNKFINAGLLQMQNYLEANPNSEPITLVVTDKFVEAEVYQHLQEWATAKGIAYQVPVTVVKAASGDEVTNYLNSKSTSSGVVNSARQGDQITDLSFFGHGYSFLCSSQGGVDCFEPGHGTTGEDMDADPSTRPEHNKWAWGVEDINKLAYTAFAKNANVDFYNCNPGTPNANGVSLISTMSNKFTSLNISGFWGRSDYAHIYEGMNSIEKFQKWLNGGIFPAKNLPVGGQKSGGAAGTGASEKVMYKGGKSVPSF